MMKRAARKSADNVFSSKYGGGGGGGRGKSRIIDMFSYCARQLQDNDLFGNKLGRL